MDIIDIMLAKAMTPQGKTDAYVAKANRAAAKAIEAQESAESAVATVAAAATDIASAQEAAATLLETAQSALTAAQSAQLNIPELYATTGQNTDGTMTQKAITDALGQKADASALASKADASALAAKADASALAAKADISYVDAQIAAIPTSGGGSNVNVNTNLGSENNGKIVVVGSDGNIIAGAVAEEDLIEALILSGGYTARNAVGLEADYDNKSFTRTQQASGLSMGSNFDSYTMYGGRRRCNVADNGTINAFYGDDNYKDDGSNGQVMVYQPKFYYQRIPISTASNKVGKTIVRDSFMVSTVAQNGFKLHPIFKTASGEELDYVLFSAYEGGLYDSSESAYISDTSVTVDFDNDKLTSVSGTKPITGTNGLSLQNAEKLANNRGTGWHIYNIAAESANQFLEIIEFGTMNGQSALGKGVSNITTNGSYNQAAITGATASLGNTSGQAASTTIETNGSTTTETENGKTSISYRGVENPWGNVWQMLNGILIYGNTSSNGGVPYITTDYNYSYNAVANNYVNVEFSLPNTSSWISALGYGNKAYDWVLMPADCASGANSALPIGDSGWFDSNLTGTRMVVQGGGWSFEDSDGPFYYGCDKQPSDSTYKSYGARLLFIPTKNEIYTANITKWQQEMEGDNND